MDKPSIMKRADPKVIQQVKLKIAKYVAEVLYDRDMDCATLAQASSVSKEGIDAIFTAGDYSINQLLAVSQVLRIHLIFESHPEQAMLSDEMKN